MPVPKWTKEDDEMVQRAKPFAKFGFAILGILIVGMLALFCTFQIPPGFVGLISTFGTIEDNIYQPGFHFKMPWQAAIPMETRTIELKETADTPTDQGLTVTLEASILYHIDPARSADIYRKLGPDYSAVVIEPTFRSVVRGVTASYDAKALYTSDREAVSGKITAELEPALATRGITLERVLLRSITLPANVRTGIEAKLIADQEQQRMDFVLQKETKEAQRKIIEAGGIAESQKIIDRSLTSQYLSWYWISSLGKYNAIAYVPIGNNGLPLFKEVDNLQVPNATNAGRG